MKQDASKKRNERMKQMRRYMPFYFFALPAIVLLILFSYMPMPGIAIAFKDFKMARGIWGSDWSGFKQFQKVFTDPNFSRVLLNTVKISLLSLITSFPVTIIFTLMVNELMNLKFKKVVQTITYMPHFLSWVVVGTFVYQMLSPTNGIVNVNLWKSTGYSIVIYLATISGIDTQLYDAVMIDGANRFQKILYVTLPAMMPTMCTMLILSIGSLISVGFDPIFNLYNDAVYSTSDVISTFVYRKGLVDSQYAFSTAVGLFQNVVSLLLVMFANWFARKANPEYRII